MRRAQNLGIGQCKLCLLAPVASAVKDPKELSGKRIVTSFPSLARKFFDKYDTDDNKTQIKYVSGSVEAACGLGLADGVIDLVETGTTMMVRWYSWRTCTYKMQIRRQVSRRLRPFSLLRLF